MTDTDDQVNATPNEDDAQIEGLLSMNWLRELGHYAVNDLKFARERLTERRRRIRRRWDHFWGPVRMIYNQFHGAEVVIFPCSPEARRSSIQLNASGYEHHANVRRAAVRKIRDRGVARGELDPNLDLEAAVED